MSKIIIDPSLSYIPQMDFSATSSENGGVEATQTFLAKKSDVTLGGVALIGFNRGERLKIIDPNCTPLFGNLTLKSAEVRDHQPGISAIIATFTGYSTGDQPSAEEDETSIPTSSLVGALEDVPLNEHPKWVALSDAEKGRLGLLLDGTAKLDPVNGKYIKFDDDLSAVPLIGAILDAFEWVTPTGDELMFARMIQQERLTFKRANWTYTYRTESMLGFTSGQLNELGKIVANPPGSPSKPGSAWTWLLTGPTQDQSGPDRFIKSLDFTLIDNSDENQFLYT